MNYQRVNEWIWCVRRGQRKGRAHLMLRPSTNPRMAVCSMKINAQDWIPAAWISSLLEHCKHCARNEADLNG